MNYYNQKQKKIVHNKFDDYWQDFEEYNILSTIIMNVRDRPIMKILSEISPKNILDVGCGMGRTMAKFKKNGFQVVGIDNSDASINICKKRGFKPEDEIFKIDASSTKFDDNSFEVVFAEGLLEHFENYEPFVREMIRVSKKYILLLQPNAHSICGKIINFGIEKFTKENVREIPYKMEDYIKSFEKQGCRLKTKLPAFFNSFVILLFQK